MRLEYFGETLFWDEAFFFQMSLQRFLLNLQTFSRYLEGPSNLDYCFSKKLRPHDTPIRLYARKSQKKGRFWEWSSKWVWNILTKPHFLSWRFFQRPLQIFLRTSRTCSIYLGDPSNLDLCVNKKLWPYDTPIEKFYKKPEKKSDFSLRILKVNFACTQLVSRLNMSRKVKLTWGYWSPGNVELN